MIGQLQNFEAKAVIFDVDGTLMNSNSVHIRSWKKAFSEFGYAISKEKLQQQMGRPKPAIARKILSEEFHVPDEEIADKVVARKTELYFESVNEVEVFPRAPELIRQLHEAGVLVGIATSAGTLELNAHIDLLGISGLIDAALTAEDIEHPKPHPEITEKSLDRLEVSPGEALFVGDSPHDMASASTALVRGIGVTTGGFSAQELWDAGAWKVYRSLKELELEMLDR